MEPWAFVGVPYMNPTILGCLAFGPGFLNQVPTLGFESITWKAIVPHKSCNQSLVAVFFVAAILCSFRMPGSARTCQSYWYKGLEVDVWSKPFYAGIWSTAHTAFQVQNNR